MSTVLTSEPHPQRKSVVPEGWLRAIVAALEAALLGWLVCVVPAIAAYVATAAAPALGETEWPAALGMGSAGWLLGHGAPAGQLSIVPLGLSAVFAAVLMFTLRRHRLRGASLGLGALAYVVLVQVVALLSPYAVSRGQLFLGSLAVAAAGAGWAWWRSGVRTAELIAADAQDDRPSTADGTRRRLVMAGLRAMRGAFAMLLLLTAVGLLATLAAIALHWDRVSALFSSYDAGLIGGTVLVLAHLAYLPTAGVWSLAYLAGPGFAVGTGTSVAPAGVELGAVPAVPMLGALPDEASPLGGWTTLVLVLLGAVAALWIARPGQARRLLDAVAATLGAALATGVVLAIAGAASSGSIGEGRMAELGPDAVLVAAIITGLLALGGLIATVAIHPATRAGISAGAESVRERRGGDAGSAADGKAKDPASGSAKKGGAKKSSGATGASSVASAGGATGAGSVARAGGVAGAAAEARSSASARSGPSGSSAGSGGSVASAGTAASGATGGTGDSASSGAAARSSASARSGASASSAASATAPSGAEVGPGAGTSSRTGSLAPAPRSGSSWRRRWDQSAGSAASPAARGGSDGAGSAGASRDGLTDTAPRPNPWSATGSMSSASPSSSTPAKGTPH
ncbi:MAG: cell division protein PerM [Actinomycetaceae bacterium]